VRLMKEQAKISKRKNQQKSVKSFAFYLKVFRRNPICFFKGRLEGQAQEIDGYILINDMPEDFEPKIGEIYNVKINEAHAYDLIGEIV
jgi:ribosomal protein S12 methylthiotransferase